MVKNKQSEESLEIEIEKQDFKHSFWTETPLSKFGFKCMMNKHQLCIDPTCQCLCHQATFEARDK